MFTGQTELERENAVRRVLTGRGSGLLGATNGLSRKEILKRIEATCGISIAPSSLTVALHKMHKNGELEYVTQFKRTGVQVHYQLVKGPHYRRTSEDQEDQERVSVVNVEGPPESRPEPWRLKKTKYGGTSMVYDTRRKPKGEVLRSQSAKDQNILCMKCQNHYGLPRRSKWEYIYCPSCLGSDEPRRIYHGYIENAAEKLKKQPRKQPPNRNPARKPRFSLLQ